ncbi:hypothetical protein D3C87_1111260 [compost metagenome]
MGNVIHSQEAVSQVKLLQHGAWLWGNHYEFNHKGETITVMLQSRRCYIYGEQRKAMISIPRRTIEGIENLNEEDVLDILRHARERQSAA